MEVDTPLIRREFNAAEINDVLNDPSVFPAVAIPGVETIDAGALVSDPRNVLLMADGGGVLFCQDEPGIYEVHTQFLPPWRGRHAIRVSLEAYRWMFTHTDCVKLFTRVPAFNKGAAFAARIVGFACQFERKAVWPTATGPVDMKYMSLDYDGWVKRNAPVLTESGRAFHRHLDEERARLGHPDQGHPDEDCHDLHVGVCAETVYGGQPEKAIVLYNRWARFAGYAQISLVARSPLVIDIGDAVLMIADRTFKVIKCR